MRKNSFWTLWGFLALTLVLLSLPQVFGQDAPAAPAAGGADDFSMPADANAPAAAPANPAEAPANPAEAPGEAPAEGSPAAGGEEPAAPAAGLDEPEHIDMLASNHKFSPANTSKDPFKPLVQKKVVLPPVAPPPPSGNKSNAPPPPPPPKPINLFVSGICGNESERLAMIVFENKPYVIQKDMVVDGKFKVVDVLPDRIVIYSNKEQMRRTFPIGGGKE